MLKKVVVLVMCAVMILAVTACAQEPQQQEPEKKDKFVIGYDIYWLGNSWSVQMYKEFEAEAGRNMDIIEEVIYTDSEGNAEKQVSNVQDLIAKNVDVIITTPNNPTALIPTIIKAREAGIMVVLNGAALDSEDYDLYVNVDDYQFGQAAGEWLADKLGGEGNIVALSGLAGISTSDLRFQGGKDVFDKHPGINLLTEVHAAWDYATAKMETSNLLAAHPEIDGVFSQGGAMTMGAIEAFEAAGRELVPMTGEDYNGFLKIWYSYLDDGFDCVVSAKPTWISSEALLLTLKVLRGENVPRDNVLPAPTITSATVGDYVRLDMPDELWCMTRMSDEEIMAMFREQGQ